MQIQKNPNKKLRALLLKTHQNIQKIKHFRKEKEYNNIECTLKSFDMRFVDFYCGYDYIIKVEIKATIQIL